MSIRRFLRQNLVLGLIWLALISLALRSHDPLLHQGGLFFTSVSFVEGFQSRNALNPARAWRIRQSQTRLRYATDRQPPTPTPKPTLAQDIFGKLDEQQVTRPVNHDKKETKPIETPKVASSNKTARRFYQEQEIAEMKESIDIVSVVESYDLDQFQRKSIHGATALCPFHSERTPSFSVDNKRGLYKCFGCEAGGDVFSFVRGMHKVQHGKEMSFLDSVRHVDQEYGDGEFFDSRSLRDASFRATRTDSPKIRQEKERIYLANAAAATFFVDQLTKPIAGGARQYLTRIRGYAPAVIRRFSMGFAPDCYYGPGPKREWGHGSLVNHLASLNFTAQECVDSGLAVVIQSKHSQKQRGARRNSRTQQDDEKLGGSAAGVAQQNASSVVSSHENATLEDLSFEDIMDRFRGRVIVPIFDSSGKHVIAFGGRVIPDDDDENSNTEGFTAPKYLNSPETAVFHKQQELFGYNVAETQAKDSTTNDNHVIVVEGYLDSVSLSSVGIPSVSAMGAAISSTQLGKAAKSFQQVIVCLDNDEAGQAAVERLCRDGKLARTSADYPLSKIRIAPPQDGVKDPAEFVDKHRDKKDLKSFVEREYVQNSLPWRAWYVNRILASLSSSEKRGQAVAEAANAAFHQVAQLLSDCNDSAEKTSLSRVAAASLAEALAPDSSETFLHQLESDLNDLASRMEATRNATFEEDTPSQHGRRPMVMDDADKLSRRALQSRKVGGAQTNARERSGYLSAVPDDAKLSRRASSRASSASGMNQASADPVGQQRNGRGKGDKLRRVETERQLTPHFAGFDFANPLDEEWLRSSSNGGGRGKFALDGSSTPAAEPLHGAREGGTKYRPKFPVYFNSNEFHGKQLLTPAGASAGYSPMAIENTDPNLFQKGVGSLIKPDTPSILLAAENALLRTLILQPAARTFLKNWRRARLTVNSDHMSAMQLSCPEKEWLLGILAEEDDDDDAATLAAASGPQQLREVIMSREDTPAGAFSTPEVVEGVIRDEEEGALEDLFRAVSSTDDFSPSTETQIDYYMQDLLGALLLASSVFQSQKIQSELLLVAKQLEESETHIAKSADESSSESRQELVTEDDLPSRFDELLKSLRQITERTRLIEESRRRTSAQALDANNSLKVEGRMSSSQREKLCEAVEDFVYSLGRDDPSWELGVNEEPYETFIERKHDEWQEYADDDYVWSPAKAGDRSPVKNVEPSGPTIEEDEDEDSETLEESLDRMEREWSSWT